MENRDRDKMSESENESSTSFGKNVGRSEDVWSEPSRKSGSSGMESERGRSGISSDEESDLGSEDELNESEDIDRGSSDKEW